MRYTANINLPIVEDNDLYSKEINNLAFERIDEEIKGLADIVETLDSPENSLTDVKQDIKNIKNKINDNQLNVIIIDNETDDEAIQRTLNEAKKNGINKVILGPKKWRLNKPLFIPSNVWLCGSGKNTILHTNTGVNVFNFLIRNENAPNLDFNIKISDMYIDAFNYNLGGKSQPEMNEVDMAGYFSFCNVDGLIIENVEFYHNFHNSIWTYDCSNIVIDRVKIKYNKQRDSDGAGIWLYYGWNRNASYKIYENITIKNSYFYADRDEPIAIASRNAGVKNIKISNNIIDSQASWGCSTIVWNDVDVSNNPYRFENIKINNNEFRGNGINYSRATKDVEIYNNKFIPKWGTSKIGMDYSIGHHACFRVSGMPVLNPTLEIKDINIHDNYFYETEKILELTVVDNIYFNNNTIIKPKNVFNIDSLESIITASSHTTNFYFKNNIVKDSEVTVMLFTGSKAFIDNNTFINNKKVCEIKYNNNNIVLSNNTLIDNEQNLNFVTVTQDSIIDSKNNYIKSNAVYLFVNGDCTSAIFNSSNDVLETLNSLDLVNDRNRLKNLIINDSANKLSSGYKKYKDNITNKIDTGSLVVRLNANATALSEKIFFNEIFKNTPIIFTEIISDAGSDFTCRVNNRNKDSFICRLTSNRASAIEITINWIAIGV